MSRISTAEILASCLAIGWGCDILWPVYPGESAWTTLPVFPLQVWGIVVLGAGLGHLVTPFLARWAWGRWARRAFGVLGVVLWGLASFLIWATYWYTLMGYFYAGFAATAGIMFGRIAWAGRQDTQCTAQQEPEPTA